MTVIEIEFTTDNPDELYYQASTLLGEFYDSIERNKIKEQPKPNRCKHGVRLLHECKDCQDLCVNCKEQTDNCSDTCKKHL